jgi:hypothetical protein
LAQKSVLAISVSKIITPSKQVREYAWPGKDITVVLTNGAVVIPNGTSDEDCIILANGYEFHCLEDYDDINTALSATDATGS